MRSWLLGFVVAVVGAGCASVSPPPPAPSPIEPSPPERNATVVRVVPKDGTWTLDALFDDIHRQTGISILYDAADATFSQAQLFICGAHTIRVDELFEWLQAVLSYRRLALVPVGPANAEGKQQWFVMHLPTPRCHPVFVKATDIGKYADRQALYVVTTISLAPTTDSTRMRNALSAILTASDGLGRTVEVPGEHALVVADFAPVVAQAVRLAAVLEKEFAARASSAEADPR